MLYLISKLDYYGVARPVAVAKSLEEADALVDKLSAEVPKGEISFFCREPMVEAAPAKDFRVVKVAAALASWAD